MHQDVEFTHEAVHEFRGHQTHHDPHDGSTRLLFLASAALFSMVSMTYLTQLDAAAQGQTLGIFDELIFRKPPVKERLGRPPVETTPAVTMPPITVFPEATGAPSYKLGVGGKVEVVCEGGFLHAKRTAMGSLVMYCTDQPPTPIRPSVYPTVYPKPSGVRPTWVPKPSGYEPSSNYRLHEEQQSDF